MSKLILGLVGEKGGGKGTFTKLLSELLSSKKIEIIRSGHLLMDTLDFWGIPKTRENLQNLAISLNKNYGEDVITKAVEKHIKESSADVVIFDGIRWDSDVKMLRRFPDNLLVYITASLQIRYERSKSRKEKEGEDKTTFDQFTAQEQASTENQIPKIGTKADVVLTNDGTLEDFKSQIQQFINKKL